MFRSIAVVLALVASVVVPLAASGADPVFVDEVAGGGRAAIRGYDPVAYHLENKPVLGRADITLEWQGATWRFASTANRAAFKLDPARYAPGYGGFCAFGASRGYKVSTDPAAFAIEGGTLYLNYSIPVANTWNKDRPGYIVKADENWKTLVDEPYETDGASVAKAKAQAAANMAKRSAGASAGSGER